MLKSDGGTAYFSGKPHRPRTRGPRLSMNKLSLAVAVFVALSDSLSAQSPTPPTRGKGLTDVEGLKVGHFTLTARPTGCTVVLVDGDGAVGGVSQRGAAPGTRET